MRKSSFLRMFLLPAAAQGFEQGKGVGLAQELGVDVIYFNPLFVSPILKFKVGSLKAGISYDIGLSDYQVDGRKNGMLFSLGFDLQNPWGARFD